MNSRSKRRYIFQKEFLEVHDIFHGKHYDLNGRELGHYFYCIYSQESDKNHDLFRDVIGLLITTKEPLGYSVKIEINGVDAWVCCDNEVRFISEKGKVDLKYYKPNKKEKKKVLKCYRKFHKEKIRQVRKGI